MSKLSKTTCVILTHRHGACVCMLKLYNCTLLKHEFIDSIINFYKHKETLLKSYDEYEFIESDNFVAARALGKTAENLANLYRFVQNKFDGSTLNNLVVGVGPGSFTGLRLGCAFANGLKLSIGTELFSITTLLRDDLLKELNANETLISEYEAELGDYRTTDQSSGYVTFFDLFYAVHQITLDKINPVETLYPQYGREPTPVLNLRKE